MALISDPDYLIHHLRIQFLKSEDRIGDRLITFPPLDELMENPYIQTAGPYPELQYAITPDIQFQGDFYFGEKRSDGDSVTIPLTPGLPTLRQRHTDSGKDGRSTAYPRSEPAAAGDGESARATAVSRTVSTGHSSRLHSTSPDAAKVPPVPPLPVTHSRKLGANAPAANSSVLDAGSLADQPHPPEPAPTDTSVPMPITNEPPVPQGHHTARWSPTKRYSAALVQLRRSIVDPDASGLDAQQVSFLEASTNNTSKIFSNTSLDTDDGIDLEADDGSAQVNTGVSPTVALPLATALHNHHQPADRHHTLDRTDSPDPLSTQPLHANTQVGTPNTKGSGGHRVVRDSLELPKRFPKRATAIADKAGMPMPDPDDAALFARVSVESLSNSPSATVPVASGLSQLLSDTKETHDNPFATAYRALSGRGDVEPLLLEIFLPHTDNPTTPFKVSVKSNATVEDVIGFTLFEYVDQGLLPEITDEFTDVAQWNVRIVEDDGTVDEDFPALDRSRQITKFGANQFALCRNASAQKQTRERPQTRQQAATSTLRISTRFMPSAIWTEGVHGLFGDTTRSSTGDPDTAPSYPQGNRLVKVHIHSTVESLRTTTMSLDPLLPMTKILHRICNKWQLDSMQYMLTTADTTVPLDLSVTLQDMPQVAELYLYRKGSNFNVFTDEGVRPFTINLTDQAASRLQNDMVKANAGLPPTAHASGADELPSRALATTTGEGGGFVSTGPLSSPAPGAKPIRGIIHMTPNHASHIYCKYTVIRRTPMFTGHERILTIDGDYIHITPTEQKHMFDSMKASAHHISAILSCNINRKIPRKFKLMVVKDQGHKSYDMEALSTEKALEICTLITQLTRQFRSGL
ncbi:Component of a membrane-bound complex containing the Tor2p kinase [Dimargaris verticillata]|uniref:Component of a membrane-bound complex containing the Tor2p kinase n=1 Tax=Dimargaris verticillata TaxID=2761393 RepID=A0A9W8B437_9FUNG|nr:Component of a membrane-bound complex containing the Tor2p kinase [Dimargaris verticillata]